MVRATGGCGAPVAGEVRVIAAIQSAGAVPTSARDLVLNSGIETKVVLAILIVLSLVSWAIMFAVGRELSKSLRLATLFAREVERAARLAGAGEVAKHSSPNAAQRVLVRALQFVGDTRRGNQALSHDDGSSATFSPTAAASRVEKIASDGFFHGSPPSAPPARSSDCSARSSASSRRSLASRRAARAIWRRWHPVWRRRSWPRRRH